MPVCRVSLPLRNMRRRSVPPLTLMLTSLMGAWRKTADCQSVLMLSVPGAKRGASPWLVRASFITAT